jgi:hypothetical protein
MRHLSTAAEQADINTQKDARCQTVTKPMWIFLLLGIFLSSEPQQIAISRHVFAESVE